MDIFNKAMSGDADACIKIMEIMQDGNTDNTGGKADGKNRKRKSKRGRS